MSRYFVKKSSPGPRCKSIHTTIPQLASAPGVSAHVRKKHSSGWKSSQSVHVPLDARWCFIRRAGHSLIGDKSYKCRRRGHKTDAGFKASALHFQQIDGCPVSVCTWPFFLFNNLYTYRWYFSSIFFFFFFSFFLQRVPPPGMRYFEDWSRWWAPSKQTSAGRGKCESRLIYPGKCVSLVYCCLHLVYRFFENFLTWFFKLKRSDRSLDLI